MRIKHSFCLLFLQLLMVSGYCQSAAATPVFLVIIVNEKAQPVNGATVRLMKDDALIKTAVTNHKGVARFEKIPAGTYAFSITCAGYKPQVNAPYKFPSTKNTDTIAIQLAGNVLQRGTIGGKTHIILHQPVRQNKKE